MHSIYSIYCSSLRYLLPPSSWVDVIVVYVYVVMQELLQSAVDVEETRFAADQKLNRRLEMMEPMSAAQREVC